MKLVIAEKPMLARDIARAICGVSVSENARLPISGNGYVVCACAGHLLELLEPEEINIKWAKWNIEDLPISCDNWKKKPVEDKKDIVDEIASLLKEADCVINAGDPDAEGQLIVDEVLEYLGWTGQTYRVFVNDNIEKNILRAFEDMKDNRECMGAGRSAYARQMADKCFGVNETRLATKRLGTLLSVGRVQTPTLGLVVERDKLIEGYTKQKFYELYVHGSATNSEDYDIALKFVPDKTLLDDDKHIFDRSKLENIANSLVGFEGMLHIESKNEEKFAPLPYNLTKLQSDMSKRYKFSAKKTLDVTQALRDKYKAITYNRSDSQYLKEEHFVQAQNVLECAMKNCNVTWWALDFSQKSKAFNEKNVTAHHGIIPQEVSIDIKKMTTDEQKVYMAIVERYAMQFMPPAQYLVCKGQIEVNGGTLVYNKKMLAMDGYLAQVKEIKDDNEEELETDMMLCTGDYKFSAIQNEISEKETKPPARYTEGTLIADMACIAKYVKDKRIKEILKQKDDGKKGENGGIGTTATRASIIEKLKKVGYLTENRGKLVSTKKARDFYALLPLEIKSADTTAKWWLIQQDVESGTTDVNAIQRSVVDVFCAHNQVAYRNKTIQDKVVVGKCPKCGQDVIKTGKVYTCSSNKSQKQGDEWVQVAGCGFKLYPFCGHTFTEKQAEGILANKQVSIRGCVSKKTGNKFDCKVHLSADGSLEPIFEKRDSRKKSRSRKRR